ncbi:unnamed protein product [Paramecium pentaurelia]|uniref:Uncharacterized protein n=1 Tax=Paramecium pentaurelia TaxID=43138 RepID=A0A8S1UWG6_9CILI|nr:unnamed protein product [Paramecium pentaurelia]
MQEMLTQTLLFQYEEIRKCPQCGIIYCESYKNEMQLLPQEFYNCKIIKYPKNYTQVLINCFNNFGKNRFILFRKF